MYQWVGRKEKVYVKVKRVILGLFTVRVTHNQVPYRAPTLVKIFRGHTGDKYYASFLSVLIFIINIQALELCLRMQLVLYLSTEFHQDACKNRDNPLIKKAWHLQGNGQNWYKPQKWEQVCVQLCFLTFVKRQEFREVCIYTTGSPICAPEVKAVNLLTVTIFPRQHHKYIAACIGSPENVKIGAYTCKRKMF